MYVCFCIKIDHLIPLDKCFEKLCKIQSLHASKRMYVFIQSKCGLKYM